MWEYGAKERTDNKARTDRYDKRRSVSITVNLDSGYEAVITKNGMECAGARFTPAEMAAIVHYWIMLR